MMRQKLHKAIGLLVTPFRKGPARLPFWMLAGALVLLLISSVGNDSVVNLNAGPEPQSSTYRLSWTLPELQMHVDAGDVVSLTATNDRVFVAAEGTPNITGQPVVETVSLPGPTLLALTRDGQSVPVVLAVDYVTAVDVLRQVGYGRLLSSEAIIARNDPKGFAALGPEAALAALQSINLRPIIGMAAMLLLIGGILLLVMRSRAGMPGSGGAFQTILPARLRKGARPGEAAIDPKLPRGLVKMDDVAGCDEAKSELLETIEFLRSPDRFTALGAQVPRGVMFFGPPGTGKTMLARAVAGEANVPFTYASGSDFNEMFVGVGASRVRKLFAEAKAHGHGVIFIDEIDALAKRRGSGVIGNDERDGTLNALLAEMDGFATNESIVVIGATNRLDVLDPAVLRPGRFTRKIHVGMPDKDARAAILHVHAGNKKIEADVDLDKVARKTAGFSGAQLADLLNESAIAAARRGADSINVDDIRNGWLKSAIGISRRRSMNDRERSIIAAHEAGHAICGRHWGEVRRVEEISLYQHGEALGITISSSEDNALPSETDLRGMLAAMMGGRVAEELLFHEITGGASNDFEQARDLTARMVRKWGLGRDPETGMNGVALVGEEENNKTSPTLREARERAQQFILDRALEDARSTLLEHRKILDRVSAYLFEHERIDGDEFVELYEGRLMPDSTVVGVWRDARSKPRDWNEIDDLASDRTTAHVPPPATRLPPPASRPATAGPRPLIRRQRSPLANLGQALVGVAIASAEVGRAVVRRKSRRPG